MHLLFVQVAAIQKGRVAEPVAHVDRAAHTLAARSTELFEAGREKVRQFLGAADAKEIVFLRGTTEAVNLVAQATGGRTSGRVTRSF